MNLLNLIPLPYRLAGGCLLLSVAVAGAAAWHAGKVHAADARGYARGHAEYTALQAEMTRRALAAEEAQRTEEARRAAAQKEIEDAHQAELQRLRADAAIADAAAGRLRQRVADLIAAARGGQAGTDPAALAGSAPTGDPAGMLADVLGRCVARVRLLATVADERGAAGSACEREYDALTPAEQGAP